MESPTRTMSSRGQDPSNWNPELGRGTPSQLRAPPAPLQAQMRVCLHPKARQGKAKHLCCWGICSRVGPWVLLGHGGQGRGRPPRLPGHVMLTTEMTGVEKGGEEGGQEGGRAGRREKRQDESKNSPFGRSKGPLLDTLKHPWGTRALCRPQAGNASVSFPPKSLDRQNSTEKSRLPGENSGHCARP